MSAVRALLALVAVLCFLLPASAQTCGFGGLDFSSLATYDLYGTDGSFGSNEDSFYVVRICGAVSDPVCSAQPGGSMVCQHAFPNYQVDPNGGTLAPFSSPACSQNVYDLIPSYAVSAPNTTFSYVNATLGASAGVQMTVKAGTNCSGNANTVVVNFLCAPLQTRISTFYSVNPSPSTCTYTFTLYTSLACPAGTTAPAAIAAPPAATATNCGYQGVSFASLAVDMNATDEAGRQYVVHPCGAVSTATTFCSYPNNAAQQPQLYPSVCLTYTRCNVRRASHRLTALDPPPSAV